MAGSGEVSMVFTADEAAAWRAIQKLTGQTQKLNDTLGQTKKKGKEATDEFKGMERIVGSGVSAITGMIGGFVSLGSAISLVNSAMAEYKQLAIEAMQQQVQLGKSQGEAVKNMVSLTDAENRQALAAAKGIQQRTKFPSQRALTDAVSSAFSLPGETSDRLSSIEAAAALTANKPEDLKDLAGGALKIGQATGNKNMRENISFALQAGAINSIDDPMKVIKNLSPILTSGMITVPKQDKKKAASEMAALFGVMAGAGGDEQGDSTQTFETTFLSKLATLYEKDKSDPGTVAGRIRDIQNNPAKLKRLLKTEFGEAKYKLPMKQLLTKDSDIAKAFEANIGQVGFDEGEYATAVRRTNTLTPQLAIARAKSRADAGLEGVTQDAGLGVEGFIAENLKKTLATTRPSSIAGNVGAYAEEILGSMESSFRRGPEQVMSAMEQLKSREELLQSYVTIPGGVSMDRRQQYLRQHESELSPVDQASLRAVRDLRDTILELAENSKSAELANVAKDIRAASEALQRAANPDYSGRAEAERQHAEAQ